MLRMWMRNSDATGHVFYVSLNILVDKVKGYWRYRKFTDSIWHGKCKTAEEAQLLAVTDRLP